MFFCCTLCNHRFHISMRVIVILCTTSQNHQIIIIGVMKRNKERSITVALTVFFANLNGSFCVVKLSIDLRLNKAWRFFMFDAKNEMTHDLEMLPLDIHWTSWRQKKQDNLSHELTGKLLSFSSQKMWVLGLRIFFIDAN